MRQSDLVAEIEAASNEPLAERYVDEEDPAVREGASWRIESVQSCEWALSRLSALRAESEEILKSAEEAERRIRDRRDVLLDRLQRGTRFFENHIGRYVEDNRGTFLGRGDRKSRTLLYGTVGWRKQPGRLVVVDDKLLSEWLQRQPDVSLYRAKIEPEMRALQERFRETGEIPPGMEFQADTEKLFVDTVNLALPKRG